MLGCKVLQICAMNVVAKVSHYSLMCLRSLTDAVIAVCIGLQAAVHGSGTQLKKLVKIMNILRDI